MPSNFPTAYDTFSAKMVIDLEDALEAVEAKLGRDGETAPSSIEARLAAKAAVGDGASAGAAVTNAQLKAWTTSDAYELLVVTLNADQVMTTATVKWPDGSGGTFTATTINATHKLIDAYTVSHTLSGKTVTQAAVTRNTEGYVTTYPALTVA